MYSKQIDAMRHGFTIHTTDGDIVFRDEYEMGAVIQAVKHVSLLRLLAKEEYLSCGKVPYYVQSNTDLILLEGYRFIEGRPPAATRKELRESVKAGVLGHVKAEGLFSEMFYDPAMEEEAMKARADKERRGREAISNIIVNRYQRL